MHCRERGLALVTVLFLLALLMVLALILSDKVLRGSRDAVLSAARDQALQAAGAGIEWARHRLAVSYRSSSGWATYLAAAPTGEGYPAEAAFRFDVGRVAVDIYLRDNPDGDGDPRRDNDLKIFVLARARPANGPEILVESLCGFEAEAAAYRQEGANSRRSGETGAAGLADPWAAGAATFQLTD
jgi:hypothetical protein